MKFTKRGVVFGVELALLVSAILCLLAVVSRGQVPSEGYCSTTLQLCGGYSVFFVDVLYGIWMLVGIPLIFFSALQGYRVSSLELKSTRVSWGKFTGVMLTALMLHWVQHNVYSSYYRSVYDMRPDVLWWGYIVFFAPFYLAVAAVVQHFLTPVVTRVAKR